MRPGRAKFRVSFLAACVLLAGGWLWGVHPTTQEAPSGATAAPEEPAERLYANRLSSERSAYLLMHAHNPVDWYPWGEEAFAKARREQKPIFLSIGYYTCHWCHVMDRESFSDPEIAAILNRSFVSIAVDREERPDIDRIYMTYLEVTTGSGGWPMTLFLTPDRKPFFGATYLPKDDSGGQPGLRTTLYRVAQAWEHDREGVLGAANRATKQLQELLTATVPDPHALGPAVLDKTYKQILASYDPIHGGFGGAPKFPRPVTYTFLFRYYARTGQKEALETSLNTLRAMARGGIHDQLGGGFHRYAIDVTWLVPHFEKMLYDQAQIADAYLDAYQITHDRFFAAVSRDVLDFSLREMRGPAGGFYSALDADSQSEPGKPLRGEGAFYLWSATQIQQVLGPEATAVCDFRYGVEPAGNVPASEDFRNEFHGKNILYERHSLAETARHFGRSGPDVARTLAAAREKLLAARAARPHPAPDDKIITASNGLMISALARASEALDEPRYLTAAQAAAKLIESKLYDPKTGELHRRYKGGQAAVAGFLDDYAFLTQGLLDLYEASFDVHLLAWAARLQETQDQFFWDAKQGGYFDTPPGDSSMLVRSREEYDGGEPAGNSIAARNLLRLAQVTDRAEWRDKAGKTFAAFGRRLQDTPAEMPQLAAALDFELTKPKQIIIAGKPGAADTRVLLRLVYQRFLPNKVLLLADGGAGQAQLTHWLPFLEGVRPRQGRATAYICENYVCKLPTPDPQIVAGLLDAKAQAK